MADPRRMELDELANRPGTYFHPQTEMLIVVDDGAALDAEIFETDDVEAAEWVLITDEIPVDEHERDAAPTGLPGEARGGRRRRLRRR